MAEVKKPKRPPKLQPLTPQTPSGADCLASAALLEPISGGRIIDRKSKLNIGNQSIEVEPEDIECMEVLGKGAYGIVEKVRHIRTGHTMAIKKITALGSATQEQKALIRDMEVLMKSSPCDNIVKFYGALSWDGDLWIFMELMDYSLDKFYRIAYEIALRKDETSKPIGRAIPERVLGKIASSIINALHYLHKVVRVIHRDIKPSNILINREGDVKLCDFGIAGYLINSMAQTYDAGCKPYMAPERINPDRSRSGYDIRSDVWSLGITMLELSHGKYPYPNAGSFFQQLKHVCDDDPPRLPAGVYSPEYDDFILQCTQKDYKLRQYYVQLLEHPFIKQNQDTEIADFVSELIDTYRSWSTASSSS